jgi:mono/diheme cytochrome c family protein
MGRRLLLALTVCALLAGCGGEETVAPTAETVVGTVPGGIDLSGGNAEAGKDIFTNVADPACSTCHTYGPADSTADVGPNLDDALQGQSPEAILESIVNPSGEITAGFSDLMPKEYGQQLSEQQLADLVAFLSPQS